MAQADLGNSIISGRPVVSDIALRLPATIELTLWALVFATVVGIPLGTLAAVWHNSAFDHITRIVTVGGLAIAAVTTAVATGAVIRGSATAGREPIPLKDAKLNIEHNATDLDTGFQGFIDSDGWQHLAEARLVYAVRPDSRWELNLGYIDSGAEEAAYAFRQGQLGLRRVDEWSGGWITGVRLAGGRARYGDEDPFFRETRRDHETRLEIDVLNRRLRIWKLTPRLHLGVVDHRSSIDFYAYRRGYLRVGMTGEF